MSNLVTPTRTEFKFTSGLFAGKNTEQIYPALKAIAHPLRLKILCFISQKNACVQDIVIKLGTTQSNVSQHLRILKDGGVVAVSRVDNRSYYRIISPPISLILGNDNCN